MLMLAAGALSTRSWVLFLAVLAVLLIVLILIDNDNQKGPPYA